MSGPKVSAPPRVLIVAGRNLANDEASALAQALAAQGADAIIVGPAFEPLRPTSAKDIRRPAARSLDSIRNGLARSATVRAAVLLARFVQARRRASAALRRHRASAVVVFDDRHLLPDRIAITAARHSGIPVALVPYAVSSLESDVFVRSRESAHIVGIPPHARIKSRIAAELPNQITRAGDGKQLLFYPPLETMLIHWSGLLPQRPWVYGGGGADLVCALGSDHAAYMTEGGVPSSRIATTGQPSLDRLLLTAGQRAQLRATLSQRYQLSDTTPLVICAVPQHAEHGMADHRHHERTTHELFSALAATGLPTLLSLHPKSERADYESAASAARLPILHERLADVLPACDLLVAAFSSTVRWAIALGIPAITLDNIDSGYELYQDIDGVRTARSTSELSQMLQAMAASEHERTKLEREAALGSKMIGPIDGRNAERAARAIRDLINNDASSDRTP